MKKRSPDQTRYEILHKVALIGECTSILGDIKGEEDVVIRGRVKGIVNFPDNQVTIETMASVEADIHAQVVVIEGNVAGDVHGYDLVRLSHTGSMKGDIHARRVILEEGCLFQGSVEMTPESAIREVPLIVDPGNASAQQVGEFLGEIATLYRMLGGSGIVFGKVPPDPDDVAGQYAASQEESSLRAKVG